MRRYNETGQAKDNWDGGPPRTVTHRVIEFDNFSEMLKHAEGPSNLMDQQRSSRNEGHEGGFYHHETWSEMLLKAHTGSPELVARAQAIKDRCVKDVGRAMPQRLYERRDDGGLFFDAGLVAEGQPDVWLQPMDSIDIEQQAIRLVYNCSVSCGATVETLIERGAGFMALAQLLQMQGRNVEIWVTRSADFNGVKHEVRVKVKDIGADGQDDQLAFVLVSPDMLRRLCFSVEELENLPGAQQGGGYGRPCECLLTGEVTMQHRYGAGGINGWVKEQLDRLVNAEDEFASQ
jgi:hypothetical protein